MQTEEGTFRAADGLCLFERAWYPPGIAKATLAIVHGYAEYSGRYGHVAEYLTREGYVVCAFDLRGHGMSEGKRVFVRSLDEYISDLDCFLQHIRTKEAAKPIFLLGHSMGGTIVTLFAAAYKSSISGVILSGALLKIPRNTPPLLTYLALAVGVVCPKLGLVKKVDSKLLSTDPEVVRRYDEDPLIYRGRMFAAEAAAINTALKQMKAAVEKVSLPLLILHGSGDHLVDMEGSKDLYNRAASRDKTLKLYDGFRHEVLNEIGKDRVLKDIAEWMETHL